ncbi:hypothetical protein [Marinobacterium sp. BA1]|uniref:hypothetical protein n=1 Tax=Marinobacterium sp. BA1 TaxID=3138931 RepID=UPI0032E7219B
MPKPHPATIAFHQALLEQYGDSLRLLLELPATRSMRVRTLALFATLATQLPASVSDLAKYTGLTPTEISSATLRMRNGLGWLALEKTGGKRGSGRIILTDVGQALLQSYHGAFKDLGFDEYRYPGNGGRKPSARAVLEDICTLADETTLLGLFDLACLLIGLHNMREMARFSCRSHGAPFLVVRTFYNMGLVEVENPESQRQTYRLTTKGLHLLGGMFYLVDQALTATDGETQ